MLLISFHLHFNIIAPLFLFLIYTLKVYGIPRAVDRGAEELEVGLGRDVGLLGLGTGLFHGLEGLGLGLEDGEEGGVGHSVS